MEKNSYEKDQFQTTTKAEIFSRLLTTHIFSGVYVYKNLHFYFPDFFVSILPFLFQSSIFIMFSFY